MHRFCCAEVYSHFKHSKVNTMVIQMALRTPVLLLLFVLTGFVLEANAQPVLFSESNPDPSQRLQEEGFALYQRLANRPEMIRIREVQVADVSLLQSEGEFVLNLFSDEYVTAYITEIESTDAKDADGPRWRGASRDETSTVALSVESERTTGSKPVASVGSTET